MSFYVGIDLGTSNTVVSTFENGILKPLKIFNEQAILPSIVLKHQVSSSTLAGFKPPKSKYGHDAVQYFLEIYKENRDEEKLRNYQIFSEFKRTLASSSQSANLTKEFLNYILDTIQNSDLQTKTIQSLVVTVPHAWKPESVERQKMQEILNSFKLQNYKLLSEPIAAASYYAYKVKPQKEETILICDLGGGTQDYTLCTISANNQIEVHDNEGSNESGGAIIDDKIREYLISKYGKPLDEHDKFYLKLQSEKLKIQFNKSIEMKLKEEAETESTLAKIMGKIKKLVKNLYNKIANLLQAQKPKQIEFGDSKLELSPNELETATNQVLPQIETHIRNLLNRNPNIQLNKCVLVGGSSNNVFLHAKIRDIVEAETLSFSEEERYMAISYGASLVASGQIKIFEKTHFNYGILAKVKGNIEKIPVLPKGTEFGKRLESKETFQALTGTSGATSIVIWRDNEEYVIDKNFGNLQNANEVKYAMQIDENGMLVVECIANDGKVVHAKNITAIHEKITKQELEKLIQPYTEIEIKNSPDKSKLVDQLEVNIQGKKVLLYNGDITWLNVDVIVSSDNSSKQMSTGVSLAIKNRGGQEILQEYQSVPMNKTKVLVTNAGKLHAKKVFHAIIDDEGQITPVYELTRNCLEIASQMNYRSIAIPVFGTGALGLDFHQTSTDIYKAIQDFLPKTNLELVVISLPLQENFEKFRKVV